MDHSGKRNRVGLKLYFCTLSHRSCEEEKNDKELKVYDIYQIHSESLRTRRDKKCRSKSFSFLRMLSSASFPEY